MQIAKYTNNWWSSTWFNHLFFFLIKLWACNENNSMNANYSLILNIDKIKENKHRTKFKAIHNWSHHILFKKLKILPIISVRSFWITNDRRSNPNWLKLWLMWLKSSAVMLALGVAQCRSSLCHQDLVSPLFYLSSQLSARLASISITCSYSH